MIVIAPLLVVPVGEEHQQGHTNKGCVSFANNAMREIRSTYPVGRISYDIIRQFIIDRRIQVSEVIQLNMHDFDNLVLNFRERHKIPMPSNVKILGVRIEERRYGIPRRNVQVISFVKDNIAIPEDYKSRYLTLREYYLTQ